MGLSISIHTITSKMPGKNNASAAKGKGFNKKNQFADRANKKVLTEILTEGVDEDSIRFGRTTKMSGNSRILVDLTDGRSNVSALIRTVLRGRAATPIGVGSVVLISLPNWQHDAMVAAANGGNLVGDPTAYVEAVLDRKTVRQLVKEKQIPSSFLKDAKGSDEEEDNGFDFDEEAEEPPVKDTEAEGVSGSGNTVVIPVEKPKWTGHGAKAAPKEFDDSPFSFE